MAEINSTVPLRETQDRDYPYFRRLWNSVVVALIAASFIPLLVIGGGMYYYTVSVIEEKTLDNLRMELKHRSHAIDEFLTERTGDLRLLASNLGLDHLTKAGNLERSLISLQSEIPCFTDLGIIDDQGRHLAYVGPYDLLSKNYKETSWFKAITKREVYISDVFLGFRNEPHFIMAVKQETPQGFWIIRATVDTVYFENMVKGVLSERSGDSFIVNSDGYFQAAPGAVNKVMKQGQIRYLKYFQGTKLDITKRDIVAMTWLNNVSWVCVVRLDRNEIYRSLRNMRIVAGAVLGLGGFIIVLTVLLTTNYLLTRLETKRRNIHFLSRQLRQSSRIASSMKLAEGFVREINDTLSNIDLVIVWIEELFQKNLSKELKRREIGESLKQIKNEVSRTRRSAERFLNTTRPSMPVIEDIRVGELLNDILALVNQELRFNRITVRTDYAEPPPVIRSDPTKLREVFQNLIMNAVTAAGKDGQITLQIKPRESGISVSVSDTGPGIPKDIEAKSFDPFFTTKSDGTVPDFAVNADILEKLGGRISVRRVPGKGATFTVDLPSRYKIREP
ncbi:MAG: hypothetical protein JW836_10740 [Deltaproteobacteria bacterium]|nr:hypothetical protein [Deltaproteobacteria bacterium]